jgi:hypothetical protein
MEKRYVLFHFLNFFNFFLGKKRRKSTNNSHFVSLAISPTEINPSRAAAGSDDATDGHIAKSTAATASSALAERTVQPGNCVGSIAHPPPATSSAPPTALLPVPTSSTWQWTARLF